MKVRLLLTPAFVLLQRMQDEIPQGRLEVIKHDSEDQEMLLQGAEFELFNKTLGISCGKQETDQH